MLLCGISGCKRAKGHKHGLVFLPLSFSSQLSVADQLDLKVNLHCLWSRRTRPPVSLSFATPVCTRVQVAATASAKGPLSQITHTLNTQILSVWVLFSCLTLSEFDSYPGCFKLTALVAPLGDLTSTVLFGIWPLLYFIPFYILIHFCY